MPHPNKMTTAMQKAAVRSALSEGMSFEEIEQDYPGLADGIQVVRTEQATAQAAPIRQVLRTPRAHLSMYRLSRL